MVEVGGDAVGVGEGVAETSGEGHGFLFFGFERNEERVNQKWILIVRE